MDFLNERLPKHLSPRLWLITIPSAVVTFDRRSGVPKLPAAPARIVGALFLAGGVALAVISQQKPEATIAYEGPLEPVVRRPAILAGLAALIGVAFLLRSTLLVLYTIAVAIAGGTERMTLEEPNAKNILGMYDE